MVTTRTHTIESGLREAAESVIALANAARRAGEGSDPVQVTIGDDTSHVPPEVAAALGETLQLLAQGRGVMIGAVDGDVTTGKAARMLGMSRTYICTLVDEGVLPCHYVGTHRRIKTGDVLAYAARRRAERQASLDELSRLSAEAGLYDDDF